MKPTRFAAFLIIAGVLVGCQSMFSARKIGLPAPLWVTRTPEKTGTYCAVGASEPTFYKEDAQRYASDNARKELARILSLDVKNIMIDIAAEKGGQVEESEFIQVSSWTTSVVLKDSKIQEIWYDEDGSASSGRKDITYALACMPAPFKKEDISKILKETDKGTAGKVIEGLKNK